MNARSPTELLERVEEALTAAVAVFSSFDNQRVEELQKTGGDPVTEVDLLLDRSLRDLLQQDGDGWLSEETADDMSRLDKELVWIVDPLDGTREFIDGLPEFCTSIAAIVDGVPIAGGVANPAAGVRVVGSISDGLSCNDIPVQAARPVPLGRTKVLASRSEVGRGQWEVVENAGITVQPMGSVAYKMARVAAGLDGATWTPVPKHEWDVAGGAALLRAIGGTTVGLDGREIRFNQETPWMEGAIAVPPGFDDRLPDVLDLARRQTASE